MRVAIFSDVHGNLSGLTAVLDSIHRQNVDHTIFAGDLCFGGPRPGACLTAMRQLGISSLYGNTDEWVIGRQPSPPALRDLAAWTLAQIDDNGRKWLARLPFSQRLSPTSNPADDLLIVHANPLDVNQIIYPTEAEQFKRYNHIRQPDSALKPLFGDTVAGTIAYGHLHLPGVRHWQNKVLVNVSSISHPGDGDSRAKYALLTWQNGRWHIEHHRITYQIQAEIDAYQTHQPPGWQDDIAQIQKHGHKAQIV